MDTCACLAGPAKLHPLSHEFQSGAWASAVMLAACVLLPGALGMLAFLGGRAGEPYAAAACAVDARRLASRRLMPAGAGC